MNFSGHISTRQMSAVLFLSRIISLFTFMLPSASYIPPGDRIITASAVMLIEFIYALVLVMTLKHNKNRSIVEVSVEYSSVFPKIIAVLYVFAFIWAAGIGTARFELFISTVMFPNSELTLMIVILLAACVAASLKGIEAIGRASSILLFIMCLSIAFILFSVAKEFEYYNLRPVLTEGIVPVSGFAFYVSTRAAELLSLNISAPLVKGNVKKMIFLWIPVFSAVCTLILVFLTGVTGEYGNDQIFPLYTLTVIAKFGIFERLDDILTGLWVLCIFIQVAYLMYISILCINQGFGKVKKIPCALICAAGIFGVYVYSSQTVTKFSDIVSKRITDIFFIALMIIVPVAVTLVNKLKSKARTKI